jgi:hypothetical protein
MTTNVILIYIQNLKKEVRCKVLCFPILIPKVHSKIKKPPTSHFPR